MRISDWSSDVCSADLDRAARAADPARGFGSLLGTARKLAGGARHPVAPQQVLGLVFMKVHGTARLIILGNDSVLTRVSGTLSFLAYGIPEADLPATLFSPSRTAGPPSIPPSIPPRSEAHTY